MTIEILIGLATGLTIIWQGRKTRQTTQIEVSEAKRIGVRAAEAAESAHNIVNSQRSEMLLLIAQLRKELAKAHGLPRQSDAVLGFERPTTLEPIVETPEARVKRLIGLLGTELRQLRAPGL